MNQNEVDNIVKTLVEVKLKDDESFPKVMETLTRIGIASKQSNSLYQSCHILQKRGRFYIVHFKELFALDGKPTDYNEADRARRNRIALLLEEWGLINIVDHSKVEDVVAPMSQIKVVKYDDKGDWTLEPKYTIGRPRKPYNQERRVN